MLPVSAAFLLLTGILFASTSDDAFAAYKRKDYATAFSLWESCAKQGVASCEYDTALMYLDGEGRPVDVAAGLQWLSLSAGQGHAPAQNYLGRVYLAGKVVTQDYARAMQYFLVAARGGQAPGQANVGLMYWRGLGVPVNLVEAFAWSELSTERLPSGAKQRDEILQELTPEQWAQGRDRAAALKKEISPPTNTAKSILDNISAWFAAGILCLIPYLIIRSKLKRAKKSG